MERFLVLKTVAALLAIAGGFNLDTTHPLIVKDTSRGRSYFGFSVGLVTNTAGSWVLVGAPRANSSSRDSTRLIEPGVIFKCSTNTLVCEEIPFQTKVQPTNYQPNFEYVERRDNGWLGVSMDVGSNKKANVVACAHLWKNTYFKMTWLPNGICYTIDTELNLNKVHGLIPLLGKYKQVVRDGDNETNFFALGQAGISSHFVTDTDDLVLGAPGISNATGSIIYTRKAEYTNTRQKKNYYIPYLSQDYEDDSYIGYSLTSGAFFAGETQLVTGAPRASLVGRVFILDSRVVTTELGFNPRMKLDGQQDGEYFGASVCSVDFNNDYNPDLLVGAPLYSEKMEEGRVYVYSNNAEGSFLSLATTLSGSMKIGARFGSVISNIGDLDQDNFEDVAIGAPYEDDVGAVYIYSGGLKGLTQTQRLLASDIDRKLRGFGISISRGRDIDDNSYSDVAIGSYDSGHAVVFRSYPVVTMRLTLIFNESQINLRDASCSFERQTTACFSIYACVEYSGNNVPEEIRVTNTLMVGTSKQRDYRSFLLVNGKHELENKTNLTIKIKSPECKAFEAHVLNSTKDILRPIYFTLKSELLDDPSKKSQFCGSCPVIRQGITNIISESISFVTNCGNDNICQVDLVANVIFVGASADTPFILGSQKTVDLVVDITNKGPDPAYLSHVTVSLPPKVTIAKPDKRCNEIVEQLEGDITFCDIESPLNARSEVRIVLKLDVSEVKMTLDMLRFMANVTSASTDVNDDNNNFILDIPVRTDADITVVGNADIEQFLIKDEEKLKEGPNKTIIHHIFQVWKIGLSPIESVTLEINIPSKVKESFLKILQAEPLMDGQFSRFGSCTGDISALSGDGPVNFWPPQNLRLASTHSESSLTSDCIKMKCLTVRCRLGPFIKEEVASVRLKLDVSLLPLRNLIKDKDSFRLVSSGRVTINDRDIVQPRNHRPDEDEAMTEFIKEGIPQARKLPDWMIPLCVVAGILLLAIVVIVLWKVGFFRRKEKEAMEKLTADDNMENTQDDNTLLSGDERVNTEAAKQT